MELKLWYFGTGLGIYLGYLYCLTKDGRDVSPKSPLLIIAWPVFFVLGCLNLFRN